MKKRILALGMAMAMLVGANAFAADGEATLGISALTGNLTVDSTVKVPVCDLTVPTSGAVILNPFGLKVSQGSGETATDVTDLVICPEYTITAGATNNVKASVYISAATVAKGTGSGVTPAATKAAYDTAIAKGTKSVLLGVQAPGVGGTAATVDMDKFEATDLTVLGATYKPDSKATDDSVNGIVLGKDMAKGDTAKFKFVGLANSDATTPWSDKDTVKVTVTYKVVMGEADE